MEPGQGGGARESGSLAKTREDLVTVELWPGVSPWCRAAAPPVCIKWPPKPLSKVCMKKIKWQLDRNEAIEMICLRLRGLNEALSIEVVRKHWPSALTFLQPVFYLPLQVNWIQRFHDVAEVPCNDVLI